jgi:putative two-component system response regulator
MSFGAINVLIADDQLENLLLLEAFLSDLYQVHSVGDGQQVLDYLQAGNLADLILLDVLMPRMDGFETCRRLNDHPTWSEIPVLFLTSLDGVADEETGLSLGAEDFIHKPFSPAVVMARVRTHLSLAQARRRLRDRNQDLEHLVAERTREIRHQAQELMRQKLELISAQSATIGAFCALAETRDNETGNHIRRTQHYVRVLAERLRRDRDCAARFSDEQIDLLYRSAPLHDIGKVGIPDRILLKPGPLEPAEWRIMQTHCELGFQAIASTVRELQDGNDFLLYAREITLCHHERYNGKGYPRGLTGAAIPLSARLMAAADVYDALISKRVYKPAYPHRQALAMMADERGGHFDPAVLDALLAEADSFAAIASRFADPE